MTRRKRALTLQEVAVEAGVSQATVSLVLNGVAGARVSDLTRERVLAAADKIGYRRAARIRADERLGSVIAMIIDDVAASPFAAPLLEGAREAAWEHQCVVSVITTRSQAQIEEAAIQAMISLPVIGIIYATLLTRQVEIPKATSDIPVVLLNCYDEHAAFSSVRPDDYGGGRSATRVLVSSGHERIGHLAGESWLEASKLRQAGWYDELKESGKAIDPDLVQSQGSSVAGGRAGAHELLDLPDPPTALFCFNDRVALGALEAARERGLNVPADLSIVGFDNDPFASSLFPTGLTTIELPHTEMAGWAVERIIQARKVREKLKPKQMLMPCPVIRRRSVHRPVRRTDANSRA